MGKARWSDPQGVDRIRQQKLIATAVAEAVGETATDVAVQRCFPRNVTTLPPLPGVLTLAEGAFGYYVDEMPVVSDGHTAWMVSGTAYGDAVDALNSPYYADHAYGLPFILPFDLDNEVWLDPIPIPLPPEIAALAGTGVHQRWNARVLRDGRKGLLAAYEAQQGLVIPTYAAPTGWTAFFNGDAGAGAGNALPAGDTSTTPGGQVYLFLVPDDQALISASELTANVIGPVAPPTITHAVFNGNVVDYDAPQYQLGQWGAEGMYAGLIGRKIYFGGGDGDIDYAITSTMLASYDLDSGEFDWTLPNLPVGVQADYCPYAVADGKLWVVGNAYPHANGLCSFDPATGVWTTHLSDHPDCLSDQMQGIQVGRTILWPVGSAAPYSQVAYNIDTDTWDTSGTPLGINETPAAVAVAPSGDILVVGPLFDSSTSASSVITRMIAPDGTVTIPGSAELGFDGPLAGTDDVKYGVLSLPDGTFAAEGYCGLAFRSSDGKPYLFGGTTVKTAELDTLHVPYLHANATNLPLGDGSVETVQIGTLPTDRTKLAAIALDGTAEELATFAHPMERLAARFDAGAVNLQVTDPDGTVPSGTPKFGVTQSGMQVISADSTKLFIAALGSSDAQLALIAEDAGQFSDAQVSSAAGNGYRQTDVALTAHSDADVVVSTVSAFTSPGSGGSGINLQVDEVGGSHNAYVQAMAYRPSASEIASGGGPAGARLHLWSDEWPAQITLVGVNDTTDPIIFTDHATNQPVFAVHPNGDVESYSGGTILHSPNGSRHRIKVANDGSLSTEVVS